MVRLREVILQAALLAAALVLIFPRTFLCREVIVPGKMLHETAPWNAYKAAEWGGKDRPVLDALTAMNTFYVLSRRALEDGEWPLWNPLELCGMPLMANYQSAVFYPARLIHLVGDLFVGTTVYILLKLWLCGMNMYLCARLLRLRPGASRFASFAWMFASYNVVWCYWPLTDISAWIPVVFLGTEWLLEDRCRKGFFTVALGAVLILLAGHPESAFAGSLGVGWYFLFRLVWERRWGRGLWKPIGLAAGAWALALAVCAVQLLPFLEYLVSCLGYSQHAVGRTGNRVCVAPGAIVAFWVPRFFGTWAEGNFWGAGNANLITMVYPGLAVWLAASLAFAKGQPRLRLRGQLWGLAATALLYGLAAFNAPQTRWLNALPLLKAMYNWYYIPWVLFALAMLAAHGYENWFSQPRRVRELVYVVPLVVVGTATAAVMYVFHFRLARALGVLEYVQGQMAMAAVAGFVGLVILAIHCIRPKARVAGGALTLLLVAELVMAVRGFLPTCPREELFFDTQLTDFLRGLPKPCRIFASTALIPPGILPVYGLEDALGYDGIYPARARKLDHALGSLKWQVMEPVYGVDYYLHDLRLGDAAHFPKDEPGRFERVACYDGIEVYRNLRAFPRAFLVGQARVIRDWDTMIAVMSREEFDPRREVLLNVAPPGPLPNAPPDGLGEAVVTEHGWNHVTVTAKASAPCILVLSDIFYPGWKAYINNRPATLFPAYHAFRGLLLPAGEHTVEYRYRPLSFLWGLFLSTMGCLVGIVVGMWTMLSRRTPHKPLLN